jgi:hypothetical protein
MNWFQTKLNQRLIKLGLLTGVLALVWFGLRLGEVNQTFAATGINQQINYQGKLSDSNGVQVGDNSWNFRFRIYDASSGGTLLWTERWTSTSTQVSTVNGVFSVTLGTITGFATSSVNFSDDSLYLQVDLDADDDGSWEESFSTRKRLTSSPYAFNADEVDGFNATSTAAVASYLMALDAQANLDLFGQGVSSTRATSTWLYVGVDATVTSHFAADSTMYVKDGAVSIGLATTTDLFRIGTSTQDYMLVVDDQSGYVGVGTSTPDERLHVDGGIIRISNDSATGFALDNTGLSFDTVFEVGGVANPNLIANWQIGGTQDDTSLPSWRLSLQPDTADRFVIKRLAAGGGDYNSFIDLFVIDSAGDVGIGVETPTSTLSIAGSLAVWNGSSDVFTVATSGNATITNHFEADGTLYVKDTNVGIGTESPSVTLEVSNTNDPQLYVRTSDDSGDDAAIKIRGARNNCPTCDIAYLDLNNWDTDTDTDFVMAKISGGMQDGSGSTGYLRFYTNDGDGVDEQMRIDKNGNVGIGTTAPYYSLEVSNSAATTTLYTVGNTRLEGTATVTDDLYIGTAGFFDASRDTWRLGSNVADLAFNAIFLGGSTGLMINMTT